MAEVYYTITVTRRERGKPTERTRVQASSTIFWYWFRRYGPNYRRDEVGDLVCGLIEKVNNAAKGNPALVASLDALTDPLPPPSGGQVVKAAKAKREDER